MDPVLEELEANGWHIESETDGVRAVWTCFDAGFYTYVYCCTNAAFHARSTAEFGGEALKSRAGITDEPFVVTNVTLHRLTDAYETVAGTASTLAEALALVKRTCDEWASRFDGPCPE